MSVNHGCIGRIYSLLFDDQQVRTITTDNFKKNEDSKLSVSKDAHNTIRLLCQRPNNLQPSDYKTLAKKYIEIYLLDSDELDKTNKTIQSTMRASKDFVKPFCDAIGSAENKQLSPDTMDAICRQVSRIAATYCLVDQE